MYQSLESAIEEVDRLICVRQKEKGSKLRPIRVRITKKLAKEITNRNDPEEFLGWGRSSVLVRDGRLNPRFTKEDILHPTLILVMEKEVSPPKFYVGEC